MSGFGGFGTTPTTGGIFGAKPPESTAFSTPTSTTTALTFGTPAFGASATGTPAFGTTGLFGSTSAAPTFGAGLSTGGTGAAASTGFTFGTAATTASGLTFGTTTTTAAVTGFTFGASTPASTGLTFGATTTTATGLTFGTTTPSAGLTFGSTTSAATGLTFGTTTAAATGLTFGTTQSAGLTFGTTTSTTGLNFGTSTTTTSGFTFGTTTTGSFGTASTTSSTLGSTLNFNLPKTTSSFLSNPATSAATTLSFNFGTPNTTTSGGFGVSQTTTSQSAGFTFNQQGSTSLTFSTTKTTAGLTFGTPTTSTSNFRFMSGTATTSASSTGFSLGKSDETAGKSPGTPGLGGVDKSQLNQGLSGTGATEPNQVKDNILPEVILQTLNDFQNFTKQQKSISVEISHGSSKPLKKVQEDTEVMESLLTMITSGLTRNALAVDKLKTETAQGLHQAEMAQRNHETPPGLEYDSAAPAEYFNDLVTKFETDTMRLRVQIEASEKHLRSLTQSTSISPQELTLAMRRLHETLVVLAARVQTLHTTVQSQKEQYRNLRRVYLKDDSAIFDKEKESQQGRKHAIFSLHSLTGPTPFSETTGSGKPLNVDGLAMLNDTTATSIISTTTNRGWIPPLSASTGTGTVLAPTSALQTPQPCDSAGFQLSKPPTGNKRNKR